MTAVLQFYSNSKLHLFLSAGIDHLIGCEKFIRMMLFETI